MATARLIYEGALRTVSTHELSGEKITTDAPVDNNGKGSAFSPTDLVATALAACMVTIMGIRAEQHAIQLGSIHATIEKIMASQPRRISVIKIVLKIAGKYTEQERVLLEEAAINCPVAKSLHPDIHQDVQFNYA